MNAVVIPAATEITRVPAGTMRRDLVQQPAHVLRLDREHQRVGLLGGRGGVRDLHAVGLAQLGRPFLPPHRRDHRRRRPARPQQPGEQRLAHLARAKNRDHRASDPSERRKNARLAGRSASRRTR